MATSSNRLSGILFVLSLAGAGIVEAQARHFEIHPSIGIARVGDSPNRFYVAPDSWHRDFVPRQGYRDAEGRIKRMGVRFRIYEVDANGKVLGEITSADAEITWRVHLVNKKSAKQDPANPGTSLNQGNPPLALTSDPGMRRVGPGERRELRGTIGPVGGQIDVKLGDLIATQRGRLIVLGGHGVAESWKASPQPPDAVHNPEWFDDTSDGWVKARIRFTVGQIERAFEARSAWVVVAPPDYAHPVMNLVTLYDLVRDRSDSGSAPATPSFTRDVYPILRRVPHLQWTLVEQGARMFGRTAMHGHGIRSNEPNLANLLPGAHSMHQRFGSSEAESHAGDFFSPGVFASLYPNPAPAGSEWVRPHIFSYLKIPEDPGSWGDVGDTNSMPPLWQLSLTPMQHEILRQWSIDNFNDDWNTNWDWVDPPTGFEPQFKNVPLPWQPAAMDKAALSGGMGGPLSPGIDAGSLLALTSTYDAPFHINDEVVEPGDVTQSLGVPWQAGFNQATGQWAPGARPVYVLVKDDNGNYTTEFWTRPWTDRVPFPPTIQTDKDMAMDYATIYANQRMTHNSLMVEHWKHLGFIIRDDEADDLLYIETERAPGF